MSEIVERLRKWSRFGYGHQASLDMAEAAARIEQLEAALLNAEKESKYSHFEAHIDRLGDVNRAHAARIEQLEAALLDAPPFTKEELRTLHAHYDEMVTDQAARIAQLEAESASLASWQCEFTDGKTGLVYGEGGSTYCAMAKRVKQLEAELALARDDALEEAAQFIEEHSARYDDANRPLLIKRPLFDSVGKPYAAAIRAMKGKP